MDKISVLQILDNLNSGGVQHFLLNLTSSIDRNRYHFIFVVNKESHSYIVKELERLDCDIYLIQKTKFSLTYPIRLARFLRSNDIDIVHVHKNHFGVVDLLVSKIFGVERRICHSHASYSTKSNFKRWMKKLISILISNIATDLWACSNDSWDWLYRKNSKERKVVINNLINYEKFSFSSEMRVNLRKKYNLDNKFVIVHTARFTLEKNHKLVIEIFRQINNKNHDTVLFLVGDGILIEKYKKETYDLKLTKNIYFTGEISNVEDYLSMADVFILPSLSEGLPLSIIEAQVNGLICLVSDVITREVQISNSVFFLNLENKQEWIDKLDLVINNKNYSRRNKVAEDFESTNVSRKVMQLYGGLDGK